MLLALLRSLQEVALVQLVQDLRVAEQRQQVEAVLRQAAQLELLVEQGLSAGQELAEQLLPQSKEAL